MHMLTCLLLSVQVLSCHMLTCLLLSVQVLSYHAHAHMFAAVCTGPELPCTCSRVATICTGPELMKHATQMQVYVRHWHPRSHTVDKTQEVILEENTPQHLKLKLSELSGIPADRIQFAKVRGNPCWLVPLCVCVCVCVCVWCRHLAPSLLKYLCWILKVIWNGTQKSPASTPLR
jgi:hypothetical protein